MFIYLIRNNVTKGICFIRFLSNQQCLNYLQHWINVCHDLGIFSDRLGAVFTRSLIRALYGVLPLRVRCQFLKTLTHKLMLTVVIILDNVYAEVNEYLPCQSTIQSQAILYYKAVKTNPTRDNLYLMVST